MLLKLPYAACRCVCGYRRYPAHDERIAAPVWTPSWTRVPENVKLLTSQQQIAHVNPNQHLAGMGCSRGTSQHTALGVG